MRNTSATWKKIVQRGEFHMETVARIYGATGDDPNGVAGSDSRGAYKQYATITAPTIKHGLLPDKTLSIGNCVGGTLSFTLMTTDKLPKSAKIVILSRVTDGKLENATKSEWLEFGTYWIDHRQVNENLIDLECYDAMKMGNQAYDDDSEVVSWPKTIKVVLQRIATQMGVAIDSRTVEFIIDSSYGNLNIVTKPNDDEVLLDVLGHIGGILGGNWYITEDNKLRYVPLITRPPETAFLLDSNYDYIQTKQGDYIIHEGESTEHVDIVNPAGGGVLKVPVVIGSVTNADLNVISRVTMIQDANHVYTRGNDTGVAIIVNENPYATDALCEALYNRLKDIEYAPYEMTNAIYDPATELGDYVYAGDKVRSVNFIMERTFDIGFSSTLAAPGEDELENEYPYQSIERRVQYVSTQSAENRTMIRQTQNDIQLISEAGGSIRSAFAIDPVSVTITAGESGGEYTGTITFNSGALIVNSNNFTLDSSGHLWCRGATIDGYSTTGDLDELERQTTLDINSLGARITSTETNKANKATLRSEFALDPTSITLTSGTISFNSNTLIVNSDNFSVSSTGVLWCRGATIEGYSTDGDLDELERSVTATIDDYGVRLEAVESYVPTETSVRSLFALDPSSITLSAGVDQSGNPTGTITFNAGALIVNSTNFTLDSSGHIWCRGATIEGYGTTTEINNLGARITSTETSLNGKANKSTLRSEFALDPTSITLSSGTITFNSNSLIVNSDYFKVAADGSMTCYAAEIHGALMLYGSSSDPVFEVTTGGILTCKGANIKGKFQTEGDYDDPVERDTEGQPVKVKSKFILDDGKLKFYRNNTNVADLGLSTYCDYFAITPGTSTKKVGIAAETSGIVDSAFVDKNGSSVLCDKSGTLHIKAKDIEIIRRSNTQGGIYLPKNAVSGSFTTGDGKTVEVTLGLITGIS